MICRLMICLLPVVVCLTGGAQELRPLRPEGPRADLINDVDQSQVVLHPATAFMESTGWGVLDVDISKLDLPALVNWVMEIANLQQDRGADPVLAMAQGMIDSLKGAGVEHLYLLGSTRSITDGGPLLVIPCKNPTVVNGLVAVMMQALPEEPALKIHVDDGLVLAGPKTAIDRVLAATGTERKDLIDPLRAENRLDHSLVIALPTEAREELAALWPDRLPGAPTLQVSPRQIVGDVTRIIVHVNLPPEPQVSVQLDTADLRASQRLSQVVHEVLAQAPEVAKEIKIETEPDFVKLTASPNAFAESFLLATAPARESAKRISRMNSLKQIGLAMHNYFAVHKHLPPQSLVNDDGERILSWRVCLLPYLEQSALYDQIDQGSAWNSDANRKWCEMVMPVYKTGDQESITTQFRIPVLPGSLWHGEGDPKGFRDIRDGLSGTIAVILAPASEAIAWADPTPWVLSEEDPMSDVFGDRDAIEVLMLDGSARVFQRNELDNAKLKALLTIDGGETVNQ